jgi:hypothetical protein
MDLPLDLLVMDLLDLLVVVIHPTILKQILLALLLLLIKEIPSLDILVVDLLDLLDLQTHHLGEPLTQVRDQRTALSFLETTSGSTQRKLTLIPNSNQISFLPGMVMKALWEDGSCKSMS